jgi:hypothetical protein
MAIPLPFHWVAMHSAQHYITGWINRQAWIMSSCPEKDRAQRLATFSLVLADSRTGNGICKEPEQSTLPFYPMHARPCNFGHIQGTSTVLY